MSLDRHGFQLQQERLVEAENPTAVSFDSSEATVNYLQGFCQEYFKKTRLAYTTVSQKSLQAFPVNHMNGDGLEHMKHFGLYLDTPTLGAAFGYISHSYLLRFNSYQSGTDWKTFQEDFRDLCVISKKVREKSLYGSAHNI